MSSSAAAAATAECVDCRQAEDSSTAAAAATAGDEQQQQPRYHDIKALPDAAPFLPTPGIVIEYCDRCRWNPRAAWLQTELLLTFPCPRPHPLDSTAEHKHSPLAPGLRSVTILPRTGHAEGGIFRVWLTTRPGDDLDPDLLPDEIKAQRMQPGAHASVLLWDRKTEGRFPEPKELKQQVRDRIAPKQDLGHSDRKP